jgi:hypothetical protein
MASSRTMVVNLVGKLAGCMDFSYELRLTQFLHRWKSLDVYNSVTGSKTHWKIFNPKKIHFMPQNGHERFQTPIFQTGTCH